MMKTVEQIENVSIGADPVEWLAMKYTYYEEPIIRIRKRIANKALERYGQLRADVDALRGLLGRAVTQAGEGNSRYIDDQRNSFPDDGYDPHCKFCGQYTSMECTNPDCPAVRARALLAELNERYGAIKEATDGE